MTWLAIVGRLALWLGAVTAAWSAAAGVAAIRANRADVAGMARRGLGAASGLALIALGALVAAFVTRDYGLRIVADRASAFLPDRYLGTAMLSVPAVAALAWAALLGAATQLRGARTAVVGAAEVVAVAGMMALALGVSAAGAPFAPTFGAVADGGILSPDLQRGSAVLVVFARLLGGVAAGMALAVTLGALTGRALDAAWSLRVRTWNALAWCLLFVATVASARWHVSTPLRGGFMADAPTAPWLLPVAIGAWLVHLDAGRQTPERVVTRVLLIAATLVAWSAAVTLDAGALVRGLTDGAAFAWFGIMPCAVLVATVGAIRRASGAVRPGLVIEAARSRVAARATHAGIVLLALVVAGASFAKAHRVQFADGEVFRARDPFGRQWAFRGEGESTLQHDNYSAVAYSIVPELDDVRLPIMAPEARAFAPQVESASVQDASPLFGMSAVWRHGLLVETRIGVANPETTPATLEIRFVPFGSWLIPAALLVVAGMLVPLVAPRAAPVVSPRATPADA